MIYTELMVIIVMSQRYYTVCHKEGEASFEIIICNSEIDLFFALSSMQSFITLSVICRLLFLLYYYYTVYLLYGR